MVLFLLPIRWSKIKFWIFSNDGNDNVSGKVKLYPIIQAGVWRPQPVQLMPVFKSDPCGIVLDVSNRFPF
jgi:hypothetical protein